MKTTFFLHWDSDIQRQNKTCFPYSVDLACFLPLVICCFLPPQCECRCSDVTVKSTPKLSIGPLRFCAFHFVIFHINFFCTFLTICKYYVFYHNFIKNIFYIFLLLIFWWNMTWTSWRSPFLFLGENWTKSPEQWKIKIWAITCSFEVCQGRYFKVYSLSLSTTQTENGLEI